MDIGYVHLCSLLYLEQNGSIFNKSHANFLNGKQCEVCCKFWVNYSFKEKERKIKNTKGNSLSLTLHRCPSLFRSACILTFR